jgi:hypothetical protein
MATSVLREDELDVGDGLRLVSTQADQDVARLPACLLCGTAGEHVGDKQSGGESAFEEIDGSESRADGVGDLLRSAQLDKRSLLSEELSDLVSGNDVAGVLDGGALGDGDAEQFAGFEVEGTAPGVAGYDVGLDRTEPRLVAVPGDKARLAERALDDLLSTPSGLPITRAFRPMEIRRAEARLAGSRVVGMSALIRARSRESWVATSSARTRWPLVS